MKRRPFFGLMGEARWLLHGVVIHPICAWLWLGGAFVPELDAIGDIIHDKSATFAAKFSYRQWPNHSGGPTKGEE